MPQRYPHDELIPPLYSKADSSLPEVARWCEAVLSGAPARLLVLGPLMSGKTHTGFAAIRRLLNAGYPQKNIAVHLAYTLARNYQPADIEQGPPVIFFDNLTDRSDNVAGVKNLQPDEPEIQALMALHQGAVADAAERLAGRANASWIACASTLERLELDLGPVVARKLAAVAEVVELPPRPRKGPVFDW